MKKSLKQLVSYKRILPFIFFIFLVAVFFFKTIFKNLIPMPADLIVGIYYPWRDYQWLGFPAGVPFKNGLLSDIVSIIYPWRIYGIELMKASKLPLWIPHALAGQPLLANFQSALFYPINIIFFLFSEIDAWTIYIMLQPLLTCIFTYFFLKSQKVSKEAAIFGSIIFAFSGFNLVWLEYGIIGHTGLWFPLILLAVYRINEKVNLEWFMLGALSVGFSFLAGYPQISIYLLIAAFCYALSLNLKKRNFLSIALVIGFFLLGILISSVQLIPGWELINNSIRNEDVASRAFNQGYISLKHLLIFVFPDYFGNPATQNFWGSLPYNETAGFVGICGLILAFYGFFAKQKNINFYRAFCLLSLLILFKPFGSLIQVLKIPGLATASIGRVFFLIDFFLAVLASFGLDKFSKNQDLSSFKKIVICLSVILAVFWFWIIKQARNINNLVIISQLKVSQRNMILSSVVFVIVALLVLISNRFRKIRKIAPWLLILLVTFELFRFGWKYNSFSKKDWLFPKTGLTDFLKQRIGIDRFVGLIPQGMSIPYAISSIEGYEPLMIRRFNLLANLINETKMNDFSVGSRWVKVNNFDSRLLDLMGVRYILSDQDQYLGKRQETSELIFQYGRSRIWHNLDAYPRVFLFHDYQVVEEDKQIGALLFNPQFNLRKTLILNENIAGDFASFLDSSDKIIVHEDLYWFNQPVFEVESQTDSLLFFSDNYYPGWQAFVDGKETSIYRANLTFRAIKMPAGKHNVKFIYRPKSFQIGAWLSCLGLAFLLFLIWFWLKDNLPAFNKKSCLLVRKRK